MHKMLEVRVGVSEIDTSLTATKRKEMTQHSTSRRHRSTGSVQQEQERVRQSQRKELAGGIWQTHCILISDQPWTCSRSPDRWESRFLQAKADLDHFIYSHSQR